MEAKKKEIRKCKTVDDRTKKNLGARSVTPQAV